jgi:hypothetical protein
MSMYVWYVCFVHMSLGDKLLREDGSRAFHTYSAQPGVTQAKGIKFINVSQALSSLSHLLSIHRSR